MLKIKFRGKKYLFVGDSLDNGGAITTKRAYVTGRPSYAHLYSFGAIYRFGTLIGDQSDIQILKKVAIPPKPKKRAHTNLMKWALK